MRLGAKEKHLPQNLKSFGTGSTLPTFDPSHGAFKNFGFVQIYRHKGSQTVRDPMSMKKSKLTCNAANSGGLPGCCMRRDCKAASSCCTMASSSAAAAAANVAGEPARAANYLREYVMCIPNFRWQRQSSRDVEHHFVQWAYGTIMGLLSSGRSMQGRQLQPDASCPSQHTQA